jgi:hypothetical protein
VGTKYGLIFDTNSVGSAPPCSAVERGVGSGIIHDVAGSVSRGLGLDAQEQAMQCATLDEKRHRNPSSYLHSCSHLERCAYGKERPPSPPATTWAVFIDTVAFNVACARARVCVCVRGDTVAELCLD